MKILCAFPWVGEFGWELFCWQGYLRKKSERYDKTYVACRAGHEQLYDDFATTIPLKIDCQDCDMWNCKGYKYPPFEQIFGTIPADTIKPPVLRYDHTHKLDNKPLFDKFKDQKFIQYGKETNQKYDIVIHARNKSNVVNANMKSNYRNWPESYWQQFFNIFRDKTVCSVGTQSGAMYIGGDDLRGIPLSQLCDVLRSSKVIVGPSSGTMHLAALCGCKQVLWYGSPYGKNNAIRYLRDWNPFKCPVEAMYCENWQINVQDVASRVHQFNI